MIKIQVDVKDATDSLSRLGTVGNAPEPKLASLQFFVDRIDQGFAEQRDPYGNTWTPLSDVTLGLRRGSNILDASGAMRGSLKIDGDTVVMDDPASFHQEGGEISVFGRSGHTLPQRRIFPIIGDQVVLPPYWEASVLDFYDAWIQKQ